MNYDDWQVLQFYETESGDFVRISGSEFPAIYAEIYNPETGAENAKLFIGNMAFTAATEWVESMTATVQ